MSNKRIELLWFTLLFLFFAVIAFVNDNTFDSGDSIQHYIISRYSFVQPELFVNHWGKPFFTILSSPFSQFGFKGIEFFNIVVSVASGYFVFKSAQKLGYSTSYFPVVILFTATDYFLCMYSGLTEPLFGLILIASFYLVLQNHPAMAAILLSFLPFVRSEGNIIIIIYTAYFLIHRKYSYIPLLAIGTILISILGYPFYKNIGWVFAANPYTSGAVNYGKGELFHFVKQMYFVAGLFYCVFLIVGTFIFLYKFSKKSNWETTPYLSEIFFLIVGSFFGYFVSHSIFWWQGWFNSFGMTRVLIAILPIGVLICTAPVDLLVKKYNNNYIVPALSFIMVLFLFSGNKAALNLRKDFAILPDQTLAKEMSQWLQENHSGKLILTSAPHVSYILGLNHFDPTQRKDIATLKNSVPPNSVIVWDNWMSPMEESISNQYLQSKKELTFVKMYSNEKDTLFIYIPVADKP